MRSFSVAGLSIQHVTRVVLPGESNLVTVLMKQRGRDVSIPADLTFCIDGSCFRNATRTCVDYCWSTIKSRQYFHGCTGNETSSVLHS